PGDGLVRPPRVQWRSARARRRVTLDQPTAWMAGPGRASSQNIIPTRPKRPCTAETSTHDLPSGAPSHQTFSPCYSFRKSHASLPLILLVTSVFKVLPG